MNIALIIAGGRGARMGQQSTHSAYPRENLRRTQAPQVFSSGMICDAHRRTLERGITHSVATCALECVSELHVPGFSDTL